MTDDLRELRDDERRALEILRKEGPMRASYLGSSLWCKPNSNRHPQHFARPAGNLLKKMEAKKLVVRFTDQDGFTVWKAAARRREDPDVAIARLRGELLEAIGRLAEEFGVPPTDVPAEVTRRMILGELTETAAVTYYLSVATCLHEAERDALLA